MHSVVIKAPAKVNITLDVNGTTDDGYHLLKMVMQSIDIFDIISISKSVTKKIKIANKGIPTPIGCNNIIYKTATEFFNYNNIPFQGLDIKLSKTIPLDSGLGGGSTDAAATLIGLNRLFDTNLSISQLQSIGLPIGSDIPFCLKGGTSMAEGIGEILTDLPDFPKSYFIVVKPDIGSSTASTFKKYDETEICNHPDTDKVIAGIIASNINEISTNIYNVLEEVISIPDINKIKSLLIENGAITSSMTGSGSAVFGIFNNKLKTKKCAKILSDLYPYVFIANPINHGPIIIN